VPVVAQINICICSKDNSENRITNLLLAGTREAQSLCTGLQYYTFVKVLLLLWNTLVQEYSHQHFMVVSSLSLGSCGLILNDSQG
jgi:hypothetical protein